MIREPLFRCSDVAMLRAPVHSVGQASGMGTHTGELAEDVKVLADLAADPTVREAVSISSPSLAHRLDTLIDTGTEGVAPRPADVRRAVRALTGYRLRMATRSTPFGIMAGVARIHFVDDPGDAKVRFGTEHRRYARPDQEWLSEVVRDCELRPEVLPELRLVLNNLCFVRGDRLVLSYVPNSAEAERSRTGVQEVSVRRTSAVRAVAEMANAPISFRDLVIRLADAFPTVPEDKIDVMLRQLVGKDILLTELRPRMDTIDPLDHVIRTLPPIPVSHELRALREDFARYVAQPLGQGRAALTEVRERMRRMSPGEGLVQVDLALDADVALPRVVAAEAERVATLLWRLAPRQRGTAELRQYHDDFLERYGQGRLVALKDLLNPDIGLGAPAGYRIPPSPRLPRPEQVQDTDRDRLVAELVQESMLTGQSEMVLTDDHPLLAPSASDEDRQPASLDLHTHLLADSVSAMREGDFRLVVLGCFGQAAASVGRFAHLLDDASREAYGAVARAGITADSTTSPVQLTYQVRSPRGGNVSQVPRWAPNVLPVAEFAEMDDPSVLRLDDVAIGGDAQGLFAVDVKSGREVVPATFHLLVARNESPNAARFLREIGSMGARPWMPWRWGGMGALPYTPRVRHGRSVLALARWRPTDRLCDQDMPFSDWIAEVAAWRRRWRVPKHICLGHVDQRIDLDLDEPAHQRLLRQELGRRRNSTSLSEVPAAAGPGTGWLAGADGVHRNEVVFPLLALPGKPAVSRTRHTACRPAVGKHLPGGEWLYASVYCSAERHDELLLDVPGLTSGLPIDRWFFLRYADPDRHLRLRFHGDPAVLASELLPRLTAWVSGLRDGGRARRMVLDTYDPEIERYGGPRAIEAAERAFHADSVAAVTQLALLASGELALDPLILAAANCVDLATRFCGSTEAGIDWLVHRLAKSPAHRAFQLHRGAALSLINPYDGWAGLRGVPGGTVVLSAWSQRSEAITRYGNTVGELQGHSPTARTDLLNSLLHMHHNRLLGTDRDAEVRAYAVARGAVEAHRERRRRGK
ncbi:lantibiotic dehydratase [Streptomyces camponoticapitis]|uniref:Lantibiotic dehydratase n=1 Tax=Streptomyces camponoticapitis TaxID=1616125 RepID=A0ABQ2EYI9_9ACTN|nr:lantibiotic dehydratase [Streptomyces camponoticapitis]GGK27755.1 lantibiotic dehydratase [Streptomyces camponoticapitis]